MQPVIRRPSRWPWFLAPATIAVYAATNLAYPGGADPRFTVTFGAILVSMVVGALLYSRVPGNVIGPLLLGSGMSLATTIAIGTLGLIATERGDVPVAVLGIAGFINQYGFLVPIVILMIGIPLVFPDGHLLSRRWRWVVVLTVAALSAGAIAQIVGPEPLGQADTPNPFHVPGLSGMAEVLDAFANWTSIIAFGAAALAIVIRWRRGDDVERHQLKWLIAVAGVAAVAFPVAFISPSDVVSNPAFTIGLLSVFALPIAIGVAILRYHLYDIDRIISRTIAWALISGLLVGAFALLVVGLQAALVNVTQGQTLAVAASTLIAFALFQPVRRTVQQAVDRRFDRARYDAHRTAQSFADRLRNEVDLDTLAGELESTVAGAVRPRAAALWLPRRETS